MTDKTTCSYFCILNDKGMERIESEIDINYGATPIGRVVKATSEAEARRRYFEEDIKPQMKKGHSSFAALVCEVVPGIKAEKQGSE